MALWTFYIYVCPLLENLRPVILFLISQLVIIPVFILQYFIHPIYICNIGIPTGLLISYYCKLPWHPPLGYKECILRAGIGILGAFFICSKIFYFLILICLVAGFIFLLKKPVCPLSKTYCALCDPVVLARQAFYQDDLVLALYTHKSILPGHCLIIPKRHVERFEGLAEEELQMSELIKKVHQAAMKVFRTSAYLLHQKNGYEVGQTVPHVHFHYVPRKAGDSSSLKFILKMYLANLRGPISSVEMQEKVEKMKQAME